MIYVLLIVITICLIVITICLVDVRRSIDNLREEESDRG